MTKIIKFLVTALIVVCIVIICVVLYYKFVLAAIHVVAPNALKPEIENIIALITTLVTASNFSFKNK